MSIRKVQFGCGFSAPEGWINYDSSPTLRFEKLPLLGQIYTRNKKRFPTNVRYGDVIIGLPEKTGSIDLLYSSHVLEHLALEDLRTALHNLFPLLRPGGTFRAVLPDLEFEIRRYLDDRTEQAASCFMEHTYLGQKTRKRGISALAMELFGNSKHLWMWDYKGLAHEFAAAGFVGIRRAQIGDSEVSGFDVVEDPGRWTNCLGIQAKKPQ